MITIKQTDIFLKWEKSLKDKKVKGIIAARIARLSAGLFGDVKSIGDNVNELRIHYGPGYRLYFKQNGNEIIILLCGGDKSSQPKDIDIAKRLAKEVENTNG